MVRSCKESLLSLKKEKEYADLERDRVKADLERAKVVIQVQEKLMNAAAQERDFLKSQVAGVGEQVAK